MADVFVANDSRTGQRVALKLVPSATIRRRGRSSRPNAKAPSTRSSSGRSIARCRRCTKYGNDDAYFYIAMEFLDGQNLSELISPRRAAAPARPRDRRFRSAGFLEAAHTLEPTIDGRKRRSLLHGDLKPRNIRVLNDDEVKVFDFGAAKALSFSRKVTRHDFGSIAYLSPNGSNRATSTRTPTSGASA